MDEQLSTWMDWIWSSRCLELLCTSTQSSNLKWVSGGGINSPRHSASRWLRLSEKLTVRWTDAYFPGASVHPVLKDFSPNRLCLFLCNRRIDRRFPLTKASVHPVLKSLSRRVSILIQTRRQIDRRCPLSDCRIIWCYCLLFFFSATRPMLLENGPSVHPTVPWFSPSVPTHPTIGPTLAF
jgi:hypothetical protein